MFSFKERHHLNLLHTDIVGGVRRGGEDRNRRRGKIKAKEISRMVGEVEEWNSGHGVGGGLAVATLPRKGAGSHAQGELWLEQNGAE